MPPDRLEAPEPVEQIRFAGPVTIMLKEECFAARDSTGDLVWPEVQGTGQIAEACRR